ncbi:MAG TPA: hypothetical protein VK524_34265 [Polyangiaceae bacterium]|nr:hypothetical protein [Polyangiaceae bacterium]
MSKKNAFRAASVLVTAMSLCTLPALAHSGLAPTPECGGDKDGKEVKKPKGGDDEKRPTNPAALCGGDKGGKEVKKPNPGDEKRPTNPA